MLNKQKHYVSEKHETVSVFMAIGDNISTRNTEELWDSFIDILRGRPKLELKDDYWEEIAPKYEHKQDAHLEIIAEQRGNVLTWVAHKRTERVEPIVRNYDSGEIRLNISPQ